LQLRDEYVVYSAHADHLGIGPPVNGDSIYNGAADNALGTAALIEIARTFVGMDSRPRRSLIFLAVTGEEKGATRLGVFCRESVSAQRREEMG
jgi:Zn-dependent M28 family amino/carboxypeptidase